MISDFFSFIASFSTIDHTRLFSASYTMMLRDWQTLRYISVWIYFLKLETRVFFQLVHGWLCTSLFSYYLFILFICFLNFQCIFYISDVILSLGTCICMLISFRFYVKQKSSVYFKWNIDILYTIHKNGMKSILS